MLAVPSELEKGSPASSDCPPLAIIMIVLPAGDYKPVSVRRFNASSARALPRHFCHLQAAAGLSEPRGRGFTATVLRARAARYKRLTAC